MYNRRHAHAPPILGGHTTCSGPCWTRLLLLLPLGEPLPPPPPPRARTHLATAVLGNPPPSAAPANNNNNNKHHLSPSPSPAWRYARGIWQVPSRPSMLPGTGPALRSCGTRRFAEVCLREVRGTKLPSRPRCGRGIRKARSGSWRKREGLGSRSLGAKRTAVEIKEMTYVGIAPLLRFCMLLFLLFRSYLSPVYTRPYRQASSFFFFPSSAAFVPNTCMM